MAFTRTPEQQAALLASVHEAQAAVRNDFDPTPDVVAPVAAAEVAPEPVAQAAAETPVVAETTEPEASEKRRKIPYERFAEVTHDNQQLKAKNEELAAKLAAIQSTPTPEPAERKWLDDLFPDDAAQMETPDAAPQTEQEKRLERLESLEADRMLERTVTKIKQDYSDLPDEVIYAGLAKGHAPEQIAHDWDVASEHIGKLYAQKHGLTKQEAAAAVQAATAQVAKKPDVAPQLTPARGELTEQPKPQKLQVGTAAHRAAVSASLREMKILQQ